MIRSRLAPSMQKLYDECYLTCSTAIFFEGQNNEAEALRSWRSALDQIYYYNAHRLPSNFVPKSETERALFESLKELELQCKERVDLLEALKKSREEAKIESRSGPASRRLEKGKNVDNYQESSSRWLGDETIPPLQYSELPTPTPALPSRPSIPSTRSNDKLTKERPSSASHLQSSPIASPPTLPVPVKKASRSPSPDHGRKIMRKTLRSEKKGLMSQRPSSSVPRRPAPMKAAGLAWDTQPRNNSLSGQRPDSDPTIEARLSATAARKSFDYSNIARSDDQVRDDLLRMPDPADYIPPSNWRDPADSSQVHTTMERQFNNVRLDDDLGGITTSDMPNNINVFPPPPPPHVLPVDSRPPRSRNQSPVRLPKAPEISYRKEYPYSKPSLAASSNIKSAGGINRKPVRPTETASLTKKKSTSDSEDGSSPQKSSQAKRPQVTRKESHTITPPSTDGDSAAEETSEASWDKRVKQILKNLPKGIDQTAAKNILNEIVVKGDEVHWEDVAGLEAAKKALKEAVVYPFLRPDLFKGLREPARGMLLFGPPGTGKTMLARAVATESKSCFFSISASSLTSKWHGESEKLVRALFAMAKVLAPSIIFVDEIDSLLSQRSGSSEHEASRRSKTEFLIQWSDLQRAAAGRDTTPGDASRVLVLAATNCPWDIDEAARRRFVRRQYIPLPEATTRETQIRTLLGHQKHNLSEDDIEHLVFLTGGYSGSDITALAKDAAMGPLRNLGEALLYTPMEKIRPIHMGDFQASLESIRPSVSKQGLEQFEDWAKQFGERGG